MRTFGRTLGLSYLLGALSLGANEESTKLGCLRELTARGVPYQRVRSGHEASVFDKRLAEAKQGLPGSTERLSRVLTGAIWPFILLEMDNAEDAL